MKNSKTGELTFNDFRRLATNSKLSRNEKIDFPESYRRGYSTVILTDIIDKLNVKDKRRQIICDIGCGCGDLTLATSSWVRKNGCTLLAVDSKEMLTNIPRAKHIHKFAGKFPRIPALFNQYQHKCNAVLCYSVLQYVFGRDDIFQFIQRALEMLITGGTLLLGDIPNEDKRNRFLKTPEGAAFTLGRRDPTQKIGDSIVMEIMLRFRHLGYETYLVPQSPQLPLATRREDIIIVKRI